MITLSLNSLYSRQYEAFKSVAISIALLIVSSKAVIPLLQVPITMQTLCVLMLGLTQRPAIVLSSMLGWIGLGAMGLPVFHSALPGTVILTGKTAGYALSFPLAAYFVSYVKNKGLIRSYFDLAFVLFAASAIIYTIGVAWLSTFIGFKLAVTYGFLIFIPSGLVKIALATFLVKKFKLI